MLEIIRYTAERQAEWDALVERSKNGTFLMKRGYMEYHSDRFADCSLMFYRDGKLLAAIPGNVSDDVFFSHKGLTYGGLVTDEKCTTADVLRIFEAMNEWLKGMEISKVVYKPVPHIYHRLPAEEDLYALFRCGARLTARGVSSSIDLGQPLKWRQNRRTALNKAKSEGVTVERSDDLEEFWKILESNLMETHGVTPVHSVDEMQLLKSRFPENIMLYIARNGQGAMVAGILLYVTENVIHSQYISATHEGKEIGAVDAIMQEVLSMKKRFFDFGISTENNGKYLNESLIFQKEGFGARAICYDIYEYTIS